jgi:hypothetical protein
LYLSVRTFIFDPLEALGCGGGEMHKRAGIPWALMKELHALGTAEYPLEVHGQQPPWGIPERFQPGNEIRGIKEKPGSYTLVSFSRVAFNRGNDKAFFAVTTTCDQCGGGKAVYAHKDNGRWVFEDVDCSWTY